MSQRSSAGLRLSVEDAKGGRTDVTRFTRVTAFRGFFELA